MDLFPNPLLFPVGLIIGVLVAAPIGPVNILCIQRSLERGMWSGVAAGMGAVFADGLVALAVALGVGSISGAVARYRLVIQLIGGTVLIVFGLRLMLAQPRPVGSLPSSEGWGTVMDLFLDMPKSFLMTITNPAGVLGLVAIFGGVSTFVEVNSTADAFAVVAAIVVGSTLWWVSLAAIVSRFRQRFDQARVARINRIAGGLLLGLGVILIGEIGLIVWRGS